MTFKLLIADDAPDVAAAIAFGARLTWPGAQVTIAGDGMEALKFFKEKQPDLVVLDIEMPLLDGIHVCKQIREISQVPILMLTVRDSTADKIRALEIGADDYLTKPFDPLELLARLRALVRRAGRQSVYPLVEPNSQSAPDRFSLDLATREVRVQGKVVSLTFTEYRLLEELVQHVGAVLPHKYLLEQVWGPGYTNETHYLKVFVRRLRRKLGDDTEHPRYIETKWGYGYRFISSSQT